MAVLSKTTIEPPPERLRRSLEEKKSEAFRLPAAAAEALEIANDPSCTAEQLGCVVSKDPLLAVDMLSLANSAAFAGGKTLTSLRQAIVRLGLRQCRNLIIASSMAGMMKRLPLEQQWVREILLHHSNATATIALYLNRCFNLGFFGEEFAAGLLHDLGRLLLALVDPSGFQRADTLDFHEADCCKMLERERQVFGTDHGSFGAWFSQQQNLPQSLVDTIRFHHEPSCESVNQKLVALTAAADHMANHLQRFGESVAYDPAQNDAIEILEHCVGRPLMAQFAPICLQIIDEALADVGTSCHLIGSNTEERR